MNTERPSPDAVHRLLSDLHRSPLVRREFDRDRLALFDRYGLSNHEQAVLNEGSPPGMASIGVHPLVQITYLVIINPEFTALADASDYLRDL